MNTQYEFRDMTDKEYKRIQVAFDEHSIEFNNPPDKQERFGFVAIKEGKLIGCSSGLAQKEDGHYGKYFYLSDLLIEKEYRRHGYGNELLKLLENKINSLGIEYIWTWTAGYEAPNFYIKQGYHAFTTFESFYPSGHSRIGFIKKL